MAKKLKVHEKQAFMVGFKTLYAPGVAELAAPLKRKQAEIDRKNLERMKYGSTVSVTNRTDAQRAWGIYGHPIPELVGVVPTREIARRALADNIRIHRVTVIRGDRVR